MGCDLAAEKAAVERLAPFGTICSEESGRIGEEECVIFLDPLDGSDNYASGFPYYGVSIALQSQGETVVSLVCDLAAKRCFLKTDSEHTVFPLYARSLREPVRKNPAARVGIFEKARHRIDAAVTLTEMGLKFRSPGAVALSFAYAYYVKYVVFFGTMRPYEMEAALHLCRDLYCYADEKTLIVAQEKKTFETLLRVFKVDKDGV